MASLTINRLVMNLRAGENIAEDVHKMIISKNPNILQEIELFQDFEDLKEEICTQLTRFYHRRNGYIYVAAESEQSDYFKVGLTSDLAKRDQSLNSAGVLNDLHFLHTVPVFDTFGTEQYLHRALKKKYPKKKEFFLGQYSHIKADVDDLIAAHNKLYERTINNLLGLEIQTLWI